MLMKGMGRGSNDLEASEDRTAVMRLERRDRVWQVQDMVENSCGVSHGRRSSAIERNLCCSYRFEGGELITDTRSAKIGGDDMPIWYEMSLIWRPF